MKNILKQAVVIGGATIGAAFATEAAANTTCGCSNTGNYYGRIDKSDTFPEAFRDAPAAAVAKGVKAGTECHSRGHGSKEGENYMATFNGQSFSKWVRFSGGNKCTRTPIDDTPKKPKVVIETPVKEFKTSTKYVIDLNKVPNACVAPIKRNGFKFDN